jgi:hypothetical protein
MLRGKHQRALQSGFSWSADSNSGARIYSEKGSTKIDWLTLQRRIPEHDETRPRGIGCIFRGPVEETPKCYHPDEKKALEEHTKHSMKEHRVDGASFVFVGSKWNRRTGLRKAPVALFEASSIEHAANMVDLHYLSSKPELTLTEWCCRIYVV